MSDALSVTHVVDLRDFRELEQSIVRPEEYGCITWQLVPDDKRHRMKRCEAFTSKK